MQTPHARKISRPRLPHRILSSLRPHAQGLLGLSGNGPCGCSAVLRTCSPSGGFLPTHTGLSKRPPARRASENAIEFPIVPMQMPPRAKLPVRVCRTGFFPVSALMCRAFWACPATGPADAALSSAHAALLGVSHPYGLIQMPHARKASENVSEFPIVPMQTPHERKASWDGRSRHAVAGANASARKASRRRERQPRLRALTGARVACPNPGLRSILHPAQ